MNHGMENQLLNRRLQVLFGVNAHSESPLAQSGAGVRLTGIDLCRPLSEGQVGFLLDSLSQFRIVCIAGQDLDWFSLVHFERFANHWGAPVPHPNNFMRTACPDPAGAHPIKLRTRSVRGERADGDRRHELNLQKHVTDLLPRSAWGHNSSTLCVAKPREPLLGRLN